MGKGAPTPSPASVPDVNWKFPSHKPYAQTHREMSPRLFLYYCTPPPAFSQSSKAYLKKQILDGKTLETPWLEVDVVSGKVRSHEGRHRALVCQELGVKKISVTIYHYYPESGLVTAEKYPIPESFTPQWSEA